MYRSQYDNDVTMWSPEGRLHQLEYACLAIDQGSAVIGLRNDNCAVLVGLLRAPSELAYSQEKLFKIDGHCGIGVSGLISDGRRLCKYMRSETLNYKYVYNKEMPLSRLVINISDKQQTQTQISSGRPYGVGLLIIGYDETGCHLYETDPTGNYYEYYGHAIGSRNQAAKTYIEKKYSTFNQCNSNDLIQHGVNALKETVRTKDIKLTVDNTSVMIVGKDIPLRILNENELEPFINKVENDENEKKENVDDNNIGNGNVGNGNSAGNGNGNGNGNTVGNSDTATNKDTTTNNGTN